MKTSKQRHQFYLPADLSAKLVALSGRSGASKTALLSEALKAWLERKADHALDERFGPRLDRHYRLARRIERKLDVTIELIGVVFLHELIRSAFLPSFTDEARRIGNAHFDHFLDEVRRKLRSDALTARLLDTPGSDGEFA